MTTKLIVTSVCYEYSWLTWQLIFARLADYPSDFNENNKILTIALREKSKMAATCDVKRHFIDVVDILRLHYSKTRYVSNSN